jgi:hypothetical protein
VQPLSSQGDAALSGLSAIVNGVEMANRFKKEMVVIDDEGLWQPEWGELI